MIAQPYASTSHSWQVIEPLTIAEKVMAEQNLSKYRDSSIPHSINIQWGIEEVIKLIRSMNVSGDGRGALVEMENSLLKIFASTLCCRVLDTSSFAGNVWCSIEGLSSMGEYKFKEMKLCTVLLAAVIAVAVK